MAIDCDFTKALWSQQFMILQQTFADVDGELHPHMFMFWAQDTENYREKTLVASISSSVRDV